MYILSPAKNFTSKSSNTSVLKKGNNSSTPEVAKHGDDNKNNNNKERIIFNSLASGYEEIKYSFLGGSRCL
jgi:hypothetical protein